jgi:hypothetical protein
MPTRREFLKSASPKMAAIVFTCCACADSVFGFTRSAPQTAYPAVWSRTPVDRTLAVPGLSADERVSIFSGTTAKLLKIGV